MNWMELGKEKGYLGFIEKKGKKYVRYIYAAKEYCLDDPEESVRASAYVELIENYSYPVEKIKLEEYPPVREGSRPSDIVVYDQDDFAFLVIEFKKADATKEDIQTGKRELFGNANLFGVRWALFDCRAERQAYFSLSNFTANKEPDLRKPDIPKSYGRPEQFTYGNGVGISLDPFTEISKFQKVVKKCHNIIRDNESLSPLEAFPVISRIIYTKIYDELNTPEGSYYTFQIADGEEPLGIASRIANLYKKASSKELEVFSPTLGMEHPDTVFELAKEIQRFSFYYSQYDVKGEAYQAFLGGLMRGGLGQYFTPREVVKPTVYILSPKEDEKIIDPCCGTGGFLIYTYKYVRDIIRKQYSDERTRQRKEYDMAHYNVFGIEIASNVAESCIAGMLLEDDAHGHIAVTNALSTWENPVLTEKGIKQGKYQVLLTNPPFGKKNRIRELKNRFTLGQQFEKPPFEVLLLERALDLLAPGGRAGFVIPDINLTIKKVLDFLFEHTIILGVVSLPSETFNPYKSQAQTSVLFFRKKKVNEKETTRIFMASVFQIGYGSTGRRKKDGKNAYEDVVVHFKKFLNGETVAPVNDDKYAVFTLEGKQIEEAKQSLKVDAYHLKYKPKKGKLDPLEKIADVLRGYTPGWHVYTEEGIPILKVVNLKNQALDYSFERRGYVTEELYLKHPDAHVQINDLLLTASAHKLEYIAKKIDVIDVMPFEKCMACGELLIIRPKVGIEDEIDPFYLLSILRTKEINDQFRARITGTTAHIYPDDISKTVLVPRLSPTKEKMIGDEHRAVLAEFRKFEAQYQDYLKTFKASIKI